jgi:hypothetical protein
MKFWQLKRGDHFRVLEAAFENIALRFDHVDGAFSLCYDAAGRIVHVGAFAPVEVVNSPLTELPNPVW